MVRFAAGLLFAFTTPFLLSGCADATDDPSPQRLPGAPAEIGNGTAEAYLELDEAGVPAAMGVAFSAAALEGLPEEPTDGHHCFDADGDGEIDPATECSPWHEFILPMPSTGARRADIPFKWALVNWNPHGHLPPGIWDVPHLDVHF